jgi:hypothetical protein
LMTAEHGPPDRPRGALVGVPEAPDPLLTPEVLLEPLRPGRLADPSRPDEPDEPSRPANPGLRM